MVSATQLAQEGFTWLGTPYSVMDCQAFVEKCLRGCGCAVNLSGSNAWYRKMTWTGTPEECREAFGCVPAGAFLFIWKDDGKEPAKYRGDGKGNASHIGLKTGRSPGAIHSSESVGRVAESNFKDKSIRGGWNRVGLWTEVRYGEPIDSRLRGGSGETPGGDISPPEMGLSQPVRVYAENGLPVKLRQSLIRARKPTGSGRRSPPAPPACACAGGTVGAGASSAAKPAG